MTSTNVGRTFSGKPAPAILGLNSATNLDTMPASENGWAYAMNSSLQPDKKFSAYRYSGTAANVLWTIIWGTTSGTAIRRAVATGESEDAVNAAIGLALVLFGCVVTVRAFPRGEEKNDKEKYPVESLGRRITGGLGVIVWCGGGMLWNLAVWGLLHASARDGGTFNILLMIPFSLVGWVLLFFLTVTTGLAFDWFAGHFRKRF